eukprot:jgi/Chrzof1/2796/UNPLg00710.t1
MSDTCAVALKRLGSNGYVKQSAYGFTWEYETHEIIPGEIWIDLRPDILEGVEGYAISSEGRIRNHKGRVGEPYAGTDGYMRFRVYPHTFMAHRLVAKAFLLNLCGKPQVNHKDGNKNNCRLDNLEWATQAENSQHAHDTGRNKSSISVRQLTADDTYGLKYHCTSLSTLKHSWLSLTCSCTAMGAFKARHYINSVRLFD